MKSPCDSCVIKMCCTKRCGPFIEYAYKTERYRFYSKGMAEKIENSPREVAIDFISQVEMLALEVLGIEKANQEEIKILAEDK